MIRHDPRVDSAKARPILEIADRLGLEGLKLSGRERVGPCPACGGVDRFSINSDRNVFNCRHCGGGDAIRLVELALGREFLDAVTWIEGDLVPDLDPAEEERRRKARAAEAKQREDRAARERARSIELALATWREGVPPEDTPVRSYLERRGIRRVFLPELPPVIRYHPALRYTVQEGGAWTVIHEGPAMIAAVSEPSGKTIGLHRTWIDLEDPSGKARIAHRGEDLPSKKMLGSKKGGAIRLTAPRDKRPVMVMGEGIETTLSAAVASPLPDAAYWAGVDLGNMAGRRRPVVNPDTGKTSTRYSDVPDLEDDDAFTPPPWARQLIFIQDGDSAPRETRAKLLSGLARARSYVPGLRTSIVHAGDGVDLNDVLKRGCGHG